jgi:hypothetical protein
MRSIWAASRSRNWKGTKTVGSVDVVRSPARSARSGARRLPPRRRRPGRSPARAACRPPAGGARGLPRPAGRGQAASPAAGCTGREAPRSEGLQLRRFCDRIEVPGGLGWATAGAGPTRDDDVELHSHPQALSPLRVCEAVVEVGQSARPVEPVLQGPRVHPLPAPAHQMSVPAAHLMPLHSGMVQS